LRQKEIRLYEYNILLISGLSILQVIFGRDKNQDRESIFFVFFSLFFSSVNEFPQFKCKFELTKDFNFGPKYQAKDFLLPLELGLKD